MASWAQGFTSRSFVSRLTRAVARTMLSIFALSSALRTGPRSMTAIDGPRGFLGDGMPDRGSGRGCVLRIKDGRRKKLASTGGADHNGAGDHQDPSTRSRGGFDGWGRCVNRSCNLRVRRIKRHNDFGALHVSSPRQSAWRRHAKETRRRHAMDVARGNVACIFPAQRETALCVALMNRNQPIGASG